MADRPLQRAPGGRRGELLADCVHCGFCLPACPTYVLWGQEMDSPRGRIHLMAQLEEGAPPSRAVLDHFDRCLSCLGCVTACPSGVAYDELIEITRTELEAAAPRRLGERAVRALVFATFPYRRRLGVARVALRALGRSGLLAALERPAVARRLPAPLRAMTELAPPWSPRQAVPARTPGRGADRGRVGLLAGCVQSVFFSGVNAATVRVLAAEGFEVVVPPRQGCCGALSAHAGRRAEAQRFARGVVDSFERAGVTTVVANAAGCGSALKEYGRLLADDPAYAGRAAALAAGVRDLSEILVAEAPRAPRRPLEMVVAYQDACHLAHAQGVRSAPRQLLAGIPGLEVRPFAEPDLCCGSAGIYNVVQREAAAELGRRKLGYILASGATTVVSANPGCMMQLAVAGRRLGTPVATMHLAEILDASINAKTPRRGAPSGYSGQDPSTLGADGPGRR